MRSDGSGPVSALRTSGAHSDRSRTQAAELAVRCVRAGLHGPPESSGSSSALSKISARIQNMPPTRPVIARRPGPPHPSAPTGRPPPRHPAAEGPQSEPHPSQLIDAQIPPKLRQSPEVVPEPVLVNKANPAWCRCSVCCCGYAVAEQREFLCRACVRSGPVQHDVQVGAFDGHDVAVEDDLAELGVDDRLV